jgi:membrane protease YdiL (CAAX protease family)
LLALGAGLAVPAVVAVLVLLLVLSAGQETTGEVVAQPAGRVIAGLVVVVLVVPFQAAAEEYLRGYLMQVVGWTWPGIAVSGLVWSALHVPSTVWGWLDLAVFSVVAGVLIARLGGLEAAIGLHVVYNLVFLAVAVPFLDESTPVASAGDADWTIFVASVVVLPLYAWVVLRVAGRRRPVAAEPAADDAGEVSAA